MSRQTSITCDQCGLQKKESNHWWMLFSLIKAVQITIIPFTEGVPSGADVEYDACSEECAHRLLGKWMRGELGK